MIKIGKINEIEYKSISGLLSRKGALCDLVLSLNRGKELGIDMDMDEVYQRLVKDMQDVNFKITQWWKETAEKYEWKYSEEDNWRLDERTLDVYLL